MLGHWRCRLVCLVVLLTAVASDESSAMEIDVEGAGSKSKIPHRHIREPDIAQRQVQISPHGSLVASSGGSRKHNAIAAVNRTAARSSFHSFFGSAQHEDAAALVQGDPSLTAFFDSECSGKQVGTYQFPAGADFRDPAHCIEVKRGGKPQARIKMSCEGETGNAQVCIWHDVTDETCTLNEPFCVVIKAEDTGVVGLGNCIKVEPHPVPQDPANYVRFTDFPEFTAWPDCLKPPMSPGLMGAVIMAGMIVAVVPLCCMWHCFFKLPAKQVPDPFGKGEGEGMPEGLENPNLGGFDPMMGAPPMGKGDPMMGKGDPMMFKGDPMMGKGDPNMMGKGKPGFGK